MQPGNLGVHHSVAALSSDQVVLRDVALERVLKKMLRFERAVEVAACRELRRKLEAPPPPPPPHHAELLARCSVGMDHGLTLYYRNVSAPRSD